MKLAFFVLLFSINLFAIDECTEKTKLYAVIENVKANGKVSLTKELLPENITPLISKFNNVVAISEQMILGLKIDGEMIPMTISKTGKGSFTENFELIRYLLSHKLNGKFRIEVISVNGFECYKEYEVRFDS